MHWVVGTGVAGLCLARELALRGREVTLCGPPVERSASWAAGGLLQLCGGRLNSAHLRLRREALAYYPTFLAESKATQAGVEFSMLGHLRLATTAQELAGLRNFSATLNSLGVAVEWHQGESLRELEGALSRRLLGGCRMPDARVEASALLEHLVGLLADLKVHRDRRRLAEIRLAERLELTFSDRSSTRNVEKLYLACGPETCSLLPLALQSYRGQTSPGESCFFDAPGVVLERSLAHKSQPHTLLPGAQRWCFSGGDLAEATSFLKTTFEEQVSLANVERRQGTRVQAPDGLPIAGDSTDPRVSLLSGLGRNGFLTAPYLAKLIVGGAEAELAAFSPQRASIDQDLRGRR